MNEETLENQAFFISLGGSDDGGHLKREMPEHLRRKLLPKLNNNTNDNKGSGNENDGINYLEQYPEEILFSIFSYLPIWDLISLQATSRLLYRLGKDKFIGKEMDFSKFKGKLSDATLLLLVSSSPQLIRLNLGNCSSLTFGYPFFEKLPALIPNLQELSLCATRTTDDIMHELVSYKSSAPHPWKLKILDLSYCANISSKFGIAQFCTSSIKDELTTLKLNHCSRISNVALKLLSKYIPNLQHLEVGGCLKITGTGLAAYVMHSRIAELRAPPCLGRLIASSTPEKKANGDEGAKNPGTVSVLRFSRSSVVVDSCLSISLPHLFPNLIRLDLRGIHGEGISATALRFMLQKIPSIKLILMKFSRIAQSDLQEVKQHVKDVIFDCES